MLDNISLLRDSFLLIAGAILIGSVFLAALISCIRWSWFKRDKKCLYKNLDVIIHDYKMEITRAIESR